MDAVRELKRAELFGELSDDDIVRIAREVREVALGSGQVLFHEGDRGEEAYLVTEGTLEILKATEGREVLVAVRQSGSIIGEMALLLDAARTASVRARTDAQLLSISKATLDRLLESSPSAGRAMIKTLVRRMGETSDRLRHHERMAQLGTLTAGVAHELNNPAAAIGRAAARLGEELDAYTALALAPSAPATIRARRRMLSVLSDRDPAGEVRDTLARSDAESELEEWLGSRGVDDPWQLAPDLVDAGIDVAILEGSGIEGEGPVLADAARFLVASTVVRDLVREIGQGARRLSQIVQALKGYAYLDRAPVQDVDVVEGLEATLVLLGHKTRHLQVRREFAPDLPTITAFGSELNHVWTNLIDNACDALAEVADRVPILTLRTYRDGMDVVVEVEDNGPGVDADVLPRIFDAFVTTKPPGRGTGLGLQISYRIVTLEHRGELTVDSEPGRTVFRVTLPTAVHEPGRP